jgi:hypothetical protein
VKIKTSFGDFTKLLHRGIISKLLVAEVVEEGSARRRNVKKFAIQLCEKIHVKNFGTHC